MNAQHWQAQEIEADNYGMQFLKANGMSTAAAASFLRKLAELPGNQGGFLSTHPDPSQRADRLAP